MCAQSITYLGGGSLYIRAPAVHPRYHCFSRSFLEKWLDLNSLINRHTKTGELGARCPELRNLRLALKAL
jgi:hypothetical protein